MIRKEQLQYLRKEFGKNITVINPNTKKPKAVLNPRTGKYEWYYNWTDDELLNAESIGVYHQEKINNFEKKTICGAVDPDDKRFVAHSYCGLLPPTLTVTKNVNGLPIQTQRIYKVNGQGFPKFDYGGDSKDQGKLIETLQSGVSVIYSKEKNFSMIEPQEIDPQELENKLKLCCFFTEVENKFPKKGQRDDAHLRLAGALARLDEKAYPTALLEDFMVKLCNNINDNELMNRVKKISYQRKQLQNGKEVFGIKELASFLDTNFKSYDLFKTNVEETKEFKPYPVISFDKMLNINYPKPKFLLQHLIREKTVTQISGDYGSGKTHLGLLLAISISQGWSFDDWFKALHARPVLYVEGELPAADIRDRITSILNPRTEKGERYDASKIFALTLDDLEMNGFKFGFEPLAITNDEDKAKRNRKLIEQMLETIKMMKGHYPVLFLDNITALTSIDENKSTDWSGLMMWLMHLKTKGIIIVFFHHTGKTTGTASGSNLSQRLVDTHIILKRLPEKAKFQNHSGVQCSVHFDKYRNFSGTQTKPFMLLCDLEGKWTKYNMLMDQKDFKILELYKEGKSAQEIHKLHKDIGSLALIYRRIDKMKKEGIIPNEKQTIDL